jgi:hypothetical protein
MALNPEVELEFGDGTYVFALRLPQLTELEEKCGFRDAQGNWRKRGTLALYWEFRASVEVVGGTIGLLPSGQASAPDAREVIRLALIGGGGGVVNEGPVTMTPILARQLCERYVDGRPMGEWFANSFLALHGAVEGFTPKKAEPASRPATRKPRSKSPKS